MRIALLLRLESRFDNTLIGYSFNFEAYFKRIFEPCF